MRHLTDDALQATAEHLTHLDTVPPLVLDAMAQVLRAAAYERSRGRPLPLRMDRAVQQLVHEVEEATQGGPSGYELDPP